MTSKPILQPTLAWLPILALGLLSLLLALLNLGSLLRLVFPAGALATAIWLYLRYPVLYVGFTWWIWFLSPWVRRMADFLGGWQDPSPVLLTPFLVTFVSGATLIRQLPYLSLKGGLPFLMAITATFYGLLMGITNGASLTALVTSFLYWSVPVLFGFHLYTNWQEYPQQRTLIYRCFLWGVLVMGSYGLYQYLVAPGWDRYWMINSEMPVIGSPEPLQIRVFSTLNSPGPFAQVLSAGLILLLSNSKLLQAPASLVGYLSLMLSLARSAWIGWVLSLLTLLSASRARLQMRLVVTIVILSLMVVPLTMVEPFSEVISARVQSLTNPEEDTSLNERMETYNNSLDLIATQGLGSGLGVVSRDSRLVLDSGLLELLFGMGWFGSIPYLLGLGTLFIRSFRRPPPDAFVNSVRSISLGTMLTVLLGNVLIGMPGMIVWAFLSLGLSGMQYSSRAERQKTVASHTAENLALSKSLRST
ncbi:MAG: O-antigen ligase domain-containing protein [Cyanobacteria bacterium J06554_6]